MKSKKRSSNGFPLHLQSPSGLSVQMNANGSVRRMDHGGIVLNLFLGSEMEGAPANLFLRRRSPTMEALPLLGPGSPAAFLFHKRGAVAEGTWGGIHFRLSLLLAESSPAWFWRVKLKNAGSAAETLDLFYAQDLALAHYSAVRTSEYYVSHYVDHEPLTHPVRGFAVASRQNLPVDGRRPWTIIGALNHGTGYATDALQFYGLGVRDGRAPKGLTEGLPSARLQHEHSMAAIQEAEARLEPGETADRGFFGWFETDHPAASSAADLVFVDKAMGLPEAAPSKDPSPSPLKAAKATPTLFSPASLLEVLDLSEDEIDHLFGKRRRHEEREGGRRLSFFVGDRRHVVLREKELKVLRPHVQILRTGGRLIPDEAALTSTAWMGGVFHSMATQGHVGINRFLSSAHGYLSLFRENGLRLFLELDGGWRLLDVPSAFEMAPQECRWIYKHRDGLLAVRSGAATDRHELTLEINVIEGPPARFLICCHVAVNGDDGSEALPVRYAPEGNGAFIRPLPESEVGRRFPEGGFLVEPLPGAAVERIGGDELLFLDGRSRRQPFLCIIVAPTASTGLRLKGRLVPETAAGASGMDEARFWDEITASLRLHPPSGSPLAGAVERLEEILPWYVQNALVHYLAPRGVEQYTGGGWGARDICQGPMEMLLSMGCFGPARDLLIRVFRAQNPDGDWPQWFTFFDRERTIRASDSHGDVVFWPVAALCQYLDASEDGKLLDEEAPFFHPEGDRQAEKATIWGHVERALKVIEKRLIPGARLAAYGHGDWNDSLQPFNPAMREHLCSAWTVTLHYQALTALAGALNRVGQGDRAPDLEATAKEIRDDFNRFLIKDGVLTGFALFPGDGRIEYLFHPRDQITGISYRLLPIIHAVINDLFTPEQAQKHLGLIRARLLGPDGARLFDRPLEYRGGVQRFFQRAESAAFFGREIGLMYTHAHLRYAEALARIGDAEGFFLALCQANPVGIRTVVPPAALRQANCYYSSSDAAFADRYEASAEYERALRGGIPFDGGWRVYSSGPGIWTRLLLQCFLGLRLQKSLLAIDPMLPRSLDGLRVEWRFEGIGLEIAYRVSKKGYGPTAVRLNGEDLPFSRGANPYRAGGVEIPMEALRTRLGGEANQLEVILG